LKNFKKLTLLTIVVVSVFFGFGCGVLNAPEEKQETIASVIPVETLEVAKGEFRKTLTLSGLANPNNILNVTPKIAGAEKVITLNIKEGDKVNQGQTLALLDQSTILIQLKQAQKAYDDALINYDRNKALFEVGAIPEANFEQIETAIFQAKSSLDAQEIALNNTIIKAPISGVVTTVNMVEGSLVTAQTPLANCRCKQSGS